MVFDKYFQGKKVLVTGAGRGIGRAVAVALYSSGAKVYAVSRTLETLTSLKEELPNIVPICVDLADWDATRKALESLERMDCVINNAAISETCSFMDISPEMFDKLTNVNLKAVINVSQITAQKMIDDGAPGRFVNMSSFLGKQAAPMVGVHASLKAALEMLSKVMAIEFGPHRITVNTVNPGLVYTPMLLNSDTLVVKGVEQFVASRTPSKEHETPMEAVVNSILFLASGIASNMNGVNLPVDGGFLIG